MQISPEMQKMKAEMDAVQAKYEEDRRREQALNDKANAELSVWRVQRRNKEAETRRRKGRVEKNQRDQRVKTTVGLETIFEE